MDEQQTKLKYGGFLLGTLFAILTLSMLIARWITGVSRMPDPVFFDSVAGHTAYSFLDMQALTDCFAYSGKNEATADCFYFVIDTNGAPTIVHMSKEQFASYQEIVDFTYSGEGQAPDPVRIYGMPRPLDENLSALAGEAFNTLWQHEYITEETAAEYFGAMYLDCTSDALSEAKSNLLIFALFFLLASGFFFLRAFSKNLDLLLPDDGEEDEEDFE